MTHFTKSQTLTTNARLFFLKNFNLIMPPLQGLYIVLEKISLLWTIWYRLRKVQKSVPRSIFEKCSVLWLTFTSNGRAFCLKKLN